MMHMRTSRWQAALLFSIWLMAALAARPAAAQVTITAEITGAAPSPEANADIQNALDFLAADFASPTPFNMTADINWSSTLPSGALAASNASSSSFQNVGGVLYPNSLDRYLYGGTVTGSADFSLDISTAFNWDYTMATPTDKNTLSLASVLYHEALHSMGFGAFNNDNGSYRFHAVINHQNVDEPTLWTTHLFDAATGQPFTADTPAQRHEAMVSGDSDGSGGDLLFIGAHEEALNSGQGVALYAPSTFAVGSSDGSHIASDQAGGDLMYYSLDDGLYRTPSPLVLSMMQDIGWNLSAAPEPSEPAVLGIGMIALAGLVLKARKRRRVGQAKIAP